MPMPAASVGMIRNNLSRMLQLPVLFGVGISAVNVANYRKSPVYDPTDYFSTARILTGCVVKAAVYATFYPLPILDLILNINNDRLFKRHFIPLSVYGSGPTATASTLVSSNMW